MTGLEDGPLQPLKVDMDAILDALMNGDPDVDWFLDLETGLVQVAIGGVDRASLVPGSGRRRYVPLPPIEPSDDYAIMERFADELDDVALREKVAGALQGKAAFAKFRAVVQRQPDLQQAWLATRRKAYVVLVVRWLESLGYSARYELLAERDDARGQRAEQGGSTPQVGLVAMLLLGEPDGKTELLEGRVHRVFSARVPTEARAIFERVARDLCTMGGVSWRDQHIAETNRFTLGDAELVQDGPRIGLSFGVSRELWQAFGRE